MSNQSFPPTSKDSSAKPAHFERDPSSPGSFHPLPHFKTAATDGYQPPAQMNSSTYLGTSATHIPQQVSSKKPLSEFAASAYETATAHEVDPHEIKILQPPPAQPIDLKTFKGFKFVTLDGLVLATRDIYDQISGTFKWEMCETQEDRCMDFIQNQCANKRVFFISSGFLGSKIVPKLHDLPQLYAVYIYCSDVQTHRAWAKNFKKVRVVCNDDDRDLLPQLAVDVAQANIDWGNALLQQGDRERAKEKFEKASINLNEHVKKPDPAMVNQVKSKLDSLK